MLLALRMPLAAQIGDNADRPGAVQVPIVPADQIPPAPALSPTAALASFTLAPGIKLELAAAEPLVQDPVAIAFGIRGEMYVVEMRGYMPDLDGNGEDQPVGRIVVLRDRDHDGQFDESKVFVDQLVLPRAVAVLADGLLVGAPPELLFFRDTNHDGTADTRTVIASDYGVRVDPKRPFLANPERAPNSLLWAYDNWIYSAAYTRKFRYAQGAWESGSTTFRGQWGLSQDDLGHLFSNSNSDHLRVDVIASSYLQRNPHSRRLAGSNVNAAENQLVWPIRVNPGINRGYWPQMLRDGKLKEFTGACAPWIYRGDLIPEFYGNAFVAEPTANVVRRSVLRAERGSIQGRNAYREQEFIASTDERFRPVNFATGPDGALYIVDLYRGVLQHRISLTSYLRKQSEDRGLATPLHLGRIYRVVPAGKQVTRVGEIPAHTPAQWVAKLGHPNSWWRETAQRVLVEQGYRATVPAIRDVAINSPQPLARVHALWALEGLGALDREVILAGLDANEVVVRVPAIRLAERFLVGDAKDEIAMRLLALAKESAPEVQLQAVLALGGMNDPAVDIALARIARAHPGNMFLRDALFSGLGSREFPLLKALLADASWLTGDDEGNRILSGLARGILDSRDGPAIENVLALAAEAVASGRPTVANVLLGGLIPATSGAHRPVMLARQPADWARVAAHQATAAQWALVDGAFDWPGKSPSATHAKAMPLSASQQARFEKGRAIFTNTCATCHQPSGRGLDGLAPPLLDSEWVLGAPERPLRIVLHGVRGPITVLGRVHTGDMPGFGATLGDEQISSVLTYIRREWGHAATPIDPVYVEATRAATAGQADAWSPEELNLAKSP